MPALTLTVEADELDEESAHAYLNLPRLPQQDPRREELPPARSIRVLLIEDNPLDATLVRNALQVAGEKGLPDRYVTHWVTSLAEAREAITRQRFDLVIADLYLPDSQGLATLTSVRDAAPDSALLVVTGQDEHEAMAESLRIGAQDYLVKGEFTYPSLERAIRYALDRKAFADERQRDLTEREQLQEQLRQAQRMEALGRLAAGVAHDFNNILTIILGHVDMLKGGVGDVNGPESLLEIQSATERAARLTSQLLAFSRQQPSSPKVLNLNDSVADLEKMLARLIGEHIELVTELKPGLAHVRVDPGHIEQVLMNLAVNARDAMPDGGMLTIRTTMVDVDTELQRQRPYVSLGRYVQLTVNDTGVGMSETVRARVFEPFFTTKEKGRGTGLGLSTVYGVVKQSGGYIWCTSVQGLGTRFDIYLPVCDAPVDQQPVVATDAGVAGGQRILVVEDDPSVRKIVVRLLRGAGYIPLEATSGEEAIALAERSTEVIAGLVTDMVMPGMTGRVVAERVNARCPGIRVVYMSGYTDDDLVRLGDLPRNHHFLQKPFEGRELLRIVSAALGPAA